MVFSKASGAFEQSLAPGGNVEDHVVTIWAERSHLLGGVEKKGTAIVGVLLLPQQLHTVEKGALIFVQRIEELKQRLNGLGTESMEDFQDIEVGWLPGDVR